MVHSQRRLQALRPALSVRKLPSGPYGSFFIFGIKERSEYGSIILLEGYGNSLLPKGQVKSLISEDQAYIYRLGSRGGVVRSERVATAIKENLSFALTLTISPSEIFVAIFPIAISPSPDIT